MKNLLMVVSSSALVACGGAQLLGSESTERMSHVRALSGGVDFNVSPTTPVPGVEAEVTLEFTDANGAPVKSFQLLHTRPVHLIGVSEDLADFIHVHPVEQADGSFLAPVVFQQPSSYRFWTEFQPAGAAESALVVHDLDTAGAASAPAAAPLAVDSSVAKVVSGVRAKLHSAQALQVGVMSRLHVQLDDAQTFQPLELEPLLGAAGHVIVISQDRSQFLHLHAEGDGAPSSGGHGGHGGGHGGHAHGGHGGHGGHSPTTGSVGIGGVSFDVQFPRAGLYKLFVQVQSAGKELTLPFVVQVR